MMDAVGRGEGDCTVSVGRDGGRWKLSIDRECIGYRRRDDRLN